MQSNGIRQYIKYKELMIMFLPVLAYYVVFCYIPMGGSVIAFKNFNLREGLWRSPWVGLENFQELFRPPSFWEIMKNTVWISLLRLAFGFPAPILLALLLNEDSGDRSRSF